MSGDILYKYRVLYGKNGSLNEFTKRLLFDGQIYLSAFESLNDPFEGQIVPQYKGITKEKVLNLYPCLKDMPDFNDIDWQSESVTSYIREFFTPKIKEDLKNTVSFVHLLIVIMIYCGLIMLILIKGYVLDLMLKS